MRLHWEEYLCYYTLPMSSFLLTTWKINIYFELQRESKYELWQAVSTCVYCIRLRFQSRDFSLRQPSNFFENTNTCIKRTYKTRVATNLKKERQRTHCKMPLLLSVFVVVTFIFSCAFISFVSFVPFFPVNFVRHIRSQWTKDDVVHLKEGLAKNNKPRMDNKAEYGRQPFKRNNLKKD